MKFVVFGREEGGRTKKNQKKRLKSLFLNLDSEINSIMQKNSSGKRTKKLSLKI